MCEQRHNCNKKCQKGELTNPSPTRLEGRRRNPSHPSRKPPQVQAPISSLPPMFLLLSVIVGCCWLLLLLVVVVLVVVAFAATAILTSRQQYPTRRCHQRYPCFGNMQNRQRGQQTAKYKSPLRTLSPPWYPLPLLHQLTTASSSRGGGNG